MSAHASLRRIVRASLLAVTLVACSGDDRKNTGPSARPAAFRDAAIYDADISDVPYVVVLPPCPASCDDQNPCTKDSCDPETHLCRNDPAAEGTTCVAADLCSLEATCKSGLCVATKTRNCTVPPDQCHEGGYCIPTTGLCTYPNSPGGKACDDANLCTTGDQCTAGVCKGAPVQCGPGLTCDLGTGQCPGFPTATWGIVLDPSASPAEAIDYSFSDLTTSGKGALYFTSGYANILDLGAGSMSTTSSVGVSASSFDYNAVIARLDAGSGRATWSRSLGDKAKQVGSSIAANAKDIVLMSGVYSGKIDFGSVQGVDAGTLSVSNTTSYPKVFLAAVDGTTGKTLWALSTDISGDGFSASLRTNVAVDPYDENFILCASPTALAKGLGASRFGGKGDALVAKLDAQSGKVLWGGQFGSAADESCDAVGADGSGKVYVTGHIAKDGSLDFDSVRPLVGPALANQQAVYVAQLSGADGTMLWGKVFLPLAPTGDKEKPKGRIKPTSLVADSKNVWVGGFFTDSAVFDQTKPLIVPSSSGGLDAGATTLSGSSAFVAAFDVISGSAVWSRNWGSSAEVKSLALSTSGTLFLAGNYTGGMEFVETGKLTNSKDSSPFVAKLAGATGLTESARGYASAVSTSAGSGAFFALALDTSRAGASGDVPFALGYLSKVSSGIDLGSPVGVLPAATTLDGGTVLANPSLFIVKFNP